MSEEVKAQALKGAKILFLRTAVSQVLRIGSSVVVARILSPNDFGIYAVVIYIAGFSIYCQNLGLGAALIQRKQEPDESDWTTAFLAQLAMAIVLYGLIATFAGPLLSFFDAKAEFRMLVIVAAFQPVIGAVGFVPEMQLQRELDFRRLAAVSFISDVAAVVLSLTLVLSGFGIWTLVVAPIGAVLARTLLLLCWVRWLPRGRFEPGRLRPLLRFGLPLQLSASASPLLDGWIPFYTNRMLGSESLGFMNLAQRLAAIPLGYLQILNQVAFPAFSRLQSRPDEVARHLEAVFYRLSVLGCLGYLILVPWVPELVSLIYGSRWEAAGNLLQFLGMSTLLLALVNILGPALNAFGYSWLRLSALFAAYGTPWILGPLLINRFDLAGVGTAMVLYTMVQLIILEVFLARKILKTPALRGTMAGLLGLFTAASCALLFGGEASLHVKLAVSVVGAIGFVAVNWLEHAKSRETTVAWCLRLFRQKS